MKKLYTPRLEEITIDADGTHTTEAWQDWGVFDTYEEAVACQSEIVNASSRWPYKDSDYHHAFCIEINNYDDNDNWQGLETIEDVIEDIEDWKEKQSMQKMFVEPGVKDKYPDIYLIDSTYAQKIIDSACDRNTGSQELTSCSDVYFPFGQGADYIVVNPDRTATSIMNDDGCAWCDDWDNFENALRYLKMEIDIEGKEID